ncbi:MAG: hypothetical protein ACLGI5_10890 [Thermoleophilia bacterium]
MAPKAPQIATAQDTLEDLLNPQRHRRSSTPLRRDFLQHAKKKNTPGPLVKFVEQRRGLALDLFLLLHCAASGGEFDVELPAMAWARALDLSQTVSSETTISKNWTWLEKQQLIRSEKHNRLRRAYLMREDGLGAEYTKPKKGEGHGFFYLPYDFFLQRWHKKLSLRARATLLICMAQNEVFELRTEHATRWYGLSPDSMQRGMVELRDARLLRSWLDYRPAPRARLGFTQVNLNRLLPPFAKATPETEQTAAAAKKTVRRKAKKTAPKRTSAARRSHDNG